MEEGYIIPVFWIDGVNGSGRMVDLAGGAVLWQAQIQNGVVFLTFPPSGVKRAQAESRRAVRLLARGLAEMPRAAPPRCGYHVTGRGVNSDGQGERRVGGTRCFGPLLRRAPKGSHVGRVQSPSE